MWAIWLVCSSSMCGKLGDMPDCAWLITKQLGKPRVCMPCSVDRPLDHLRVRVTPSTPRTSKPARLEKSVLVSKPVAKIRQSSSVSRPPATTPRSVIASTPRPAVSTRVTLGWLKACRY